MLLAALVVGSWLLPGPAAQARPQRLLIITPTGLPPSPTVAAPPSATAAPPTATPNIVVPATDTPTVVVPATATPTSGGPAKTTTPVGPTGTASSPDITATPRNTREAAPGPELHISKSASVAEGRPGDFVTFTLIASNNGKGAASNATISDDMPAFLEIYNVKTTKGIAANQGQRVTVQLDTLAPGESVEVTILARIRDDATAQDGTNIAVLERPNGERVVSERVRVAVRLELIDTPLAGTPLAGTPTTAGPVVTSTVTTGAPGALPNTSDAGSGGIEALVLLFAVGLLIVSAGWALLGIRRR